MTRMAQPRVPPPVVMPTNVCYICAGSVVRGGGTVYVVEVEAEGRLFRAVVHRACLEAGVRAGEFRRVPEGGDG